jgi:F-type H+-transporting ATPase subunit delta
MKNAVVGRRYAKALFEASQSLEEIESNFAALKNLAMSWQTSKDLQSFSLSPSFSVEQKKQVYSTLLQSMNTSKVALSFVNRVVEAGRIGLVEDIFLEFKKLSNEKRGFVDVVIETAKPLSPQQVKDICSGIEKVSGKKANAETKLNSKLLAGTKVHFSGKTLDGSLRARLDNLEKHLLSEELKKHATA